MGLSEIIRPYARKLHEICEETVNVSILDHDPGDVYHSVVILKVRSPNQVLIVSPPVGASSECHNSSVGKCLLAFSRDVDLSIYETKKLTANTKNTITSVEELRAELEKVRADGYAMDCDEKEIGLTCIGAPILDSKGHALAAISLSGPTSRMMAGNLHEKIMVVRQIAAEISRDL